MGNKNIITNNHLKLSSKAIKIHKTLLEAKALFVAK